MKFDDFIQRVRAEFSPARSLEADLTQAELQDLLHVVNGIVRDALRPMSREEFRTFMEQQKKAA